MTVSKTELVVMVVEVPGDNRNIVNNNDKVFYLSVVFYFLFFYFTKACSYSAFYAHISNENIVAFKIKTYLILPGCRAYHIITKKKKKKAPPPLPPNSWMWHKTS